MGSFKCGDMVRIHSISSHLDGTKAKICGIVSSYPEVTFYIIELYKTPIGEWTHISLSDACLTRD